MPSLERRKVSGSTLEDQCRPRKRRRVSNASESSQSTDSSGSYTITSLRQIVSEEIDLEIGLRQRLATTINDRITWASQLQESLNRESETGNDVSADLGTSAMGDLEVIEAPCHILLSRTSFRLPPPRVAGQESPFPQPDIPVHSRRRTARRIPVPYAPNKAKLLFIRHNTDEGLILVKIQCPDCSRSSFPNLQGCFNHCLLKHKRQYGSHDECIQRCAVVVPDAEKDWVLENGTEIGGGHLPSLRRLFEMAVGGGGDNEMDKFDGSSAVASHADQNRKQGDVDTSVHLTRTLGLHKDSPSLAPFLGTVPRKRCISAYNEDEDVDVLGNISSSSFSLGQQGSWRKPYPHRNKARPELDVVADVSESRIGHSSEATHLAARVVPLDATRTRFHILARVVIADRSLWIPPDRRPSNRPTHTHRWMVSVDAPSYSLHISTFLQKMIVSGVTEPLPSTLESPIVITDPPFVAISTTDKPFLARIELEWVGLQNAPMVVEHWVELEEYKHHNPVLGDEQVLDVELDRSTELLPVQQNRTTRNLKDADDSPETEEESCVQASSVAILPDYAKALTSLLHRFPMTLKEVKGRSHPLLPYRLVDSPQQLKSLVSGRRKAIEWARARALQDAYWHDYTDKPGLIPLTTRDVFCWLEDEGHFLRPAVDVQNMQTIAQTYEDNSDTAKSTLPSPDVFCYSCGFSASLHEQQMAKAKQSRNGSFCFLSAPNLNPVLDVERLLGSLAEPTGDAAKVEPSYEFSQALVQTSLWGKVQPADLVTTVNPSMTMSALHLVTASRSCQGETPERMSSLLKQPGSNKHTVEEKLAGPAFLALLVKPFLRQLLSNAVRVMKKQDESVQIRTHRRARRTRLLTPLHIVEGLAMGAPHGWLEGNGPLIMGDLGMRLKSDSFLSTFDTAKPTGIKQEEDLRPACRSERPEGEYS